MVEKISKGKKDIPLGIHAQTILQRKLCIRYFNNHFVWLICMVVDFQLRLSGQLEINIILN